jgi:hypothetical protein
MTDSHVSNVRVWFPGILIIIITKPFNVKLKMAFLGLSSTRMFYDSFNKESLRAMSVGFVLRGSKRKGLMSVTW